MPAQRNSRALLAALLACALAACSALLPQTYGFSIGELQARLAQRMPYKKTVMGVLEVELTRPRLALDPTQNRLATLFDATIRAPLAGRAYVGAIGISGVPRYESGTRSILLGSARLDVLELDGLSPTLAKQVREMANALAPEVFDRTPLHTFKPEDLRFGGVTLDPQSIRMSADRLIVDLAPR